MPTTDVTSTGCWYHTSREGSAARWAQGAARKGLYDGKQSLSIVAFDAEAIATAIGEHPLPQAQLILRRDSAYGDSEVTVSVAPLRMTDMPAGYMTRRQCMDLARREIHRCVPTSGTTALIDLPGSMLRALKAGEVNAFLIYQEDDGSDSYCRLSTSAILRIYADEDWHTPVWTRTVSTGDVISSPIISHIAELKELEYYINLRLHHDGDTAHDVDITSGNDVGAYADWPGVIAALQAGVDQYKDDEAQEQVGNKWLRPVAGEMPRAEIVEQLHAIVRGDDRTRLESAAGFTGVQRHNKSEQTWYANTAVKWEAKDLPVAGQTSEQMTVSGQGGSPVTITVYDNHCCGWIFDRGEDQVTINAATVEIKAMKAEGEHNPHVTLYGIKPQTLPENTTVIGDIFDDTVIGEADCVIGDVTYILINAAGKAKLNEGTIHGVGIKYTNEYVQLAKTAALLINEETEPAPEEPAEEQESEGT